LSTFEETKKQMLSVLIPVYHWDPSLLVRDLQKQLDDSCLEYEIIIGDDTPASHKPEYQIQLESSPKIICSFRNASLGRSANRNRLADAARYPYLVFIDGDAGVARPDFISRYVSHLNQETILAGGTLYPDIKPEDPALHLRWKVGKSREQKTAQERQKYPWNSFSTFNFVAPSAVFKKIRFNEKITAYGHEDTFFGFQLKTHGIPIIHIDNGLYHLGLEPADQFLLKVRESVHNLFMLKESGILPPGMIPDVKLLNKYESVCKTGTQGLIKLLYRILHKLMENRLTKPDPPLYLLDLYKLGLISQIA
jgi:glycosyltransferase involved in cell wall biosynthesis